MAFGKFGRYYPDGEDVRVRPFDLAALLREDVAAVAAGPGAGHRVRFESDVDEAPLESDPQHIRYVLVNLLLNAVKYSPHGSEVRVELLAREAGVEVRVSDEGIGIPPAEVDALFSPFYRASNVGTAPGTGMGLAIAKKSASLIGATLEVRRRPGGGTVFAVRVPATATPR